jgi:hypothetical protein
MNVPESDPRPSGAAHRVEVASELMLLPDGRILAHHLTPELAALIEQALSMPAGRPPVPPVPSSESPKP